jgi:predicted helicase
VFLPLVKTSQKFTELLNVHGLRAVEVNGNSKDREEGIRAFENGEYDVLCNSMLLTEGWDCPSVDCIVILRPTKVRSLYQQMVGRGMRLAPNKEYLLLLDFLWLTERHDLCKPSGLLAKNEEEAKKIDEKIANSGYEVDLVEAEEEAKRDIVAERENALKRELEEMRRKKRQLVDPIQYAFSINAEDLADYEPTFAWEMAPMSSKQKEYLERHGIYTEDIGNAGLASLIIDKLKNRQIEGLATPKQIRLLERYGFLHVGLWTFDDASLMITRIANNRWFVPFEINPKTYEPRKGIMA